MIWKFYCNGFKQISELQKGAKRLQCSSDFMNKFISSDFSLSTVFVKLEISLGIKDNDINDKMVIFYQILVTFIIIQSYYRR